VVNLADPGTLGTAVADVDVDDDVETAADAVVADEGAEA